MIILHIDLPGKTINRDSGLVEMLDVLADIEMNRANLSLDEIETLRGWILILAEKMAPGEGVMNHLGTNVSVGKTAEGRAFIKDLKGEWPPPRPNFDDGFLHA